MASYERETEMRKRNIDTSDESSSEAWIATTTSTRTATGTVHNSIGSTGLDPHCLVHSTRKPPQSPV
jgi:hypothetical protein